MNAYDVNKDESYSKEEKEYLVLPVKKATPRWFSTRTQIIVMPSKGLWHI